MTVDEGPAIDPLHPIPGNARLVQEEIDRLWAVRRCCQDSMNELRMLDVSAWRGEAAAAFDAVRDAQVTQWSSAERALGLAIDAYGDYHGSLLALQPLAREAVARATRTGDWHRFTEDVRRWRAQLAAENQRAADRVTLAAHELSEIRRLVHTDAPGRVTITPVVDATHPAEVTVSDYAETTQRIVHELIAEQKSPEQLNMFTAALCDGLLQATYCSAEQL